MSIYKKVKSLIRTRTEFTKNVMLLTRGTAIAQFLPIVISPFLTRMFSPEEFGVLALYISLLSVLGIVATGRYELAIVLPARNADAIQLAWLSILLSLVVSFLLMLIVIILADSITSVLNAPSIRIYLYFIPVSVFAYGVSQSFLFYLNREKKYREMSSISIVRSSSAAGIQVATGVARHFDNDLFSKIGLVPGYIIGQIFSLIQSSRLVFSRLRGADTFSWKEVQVRPAEMHRLALEYSSLPKYNAPSSLLNTASVQSAPVILSSLFSASVAGFFSLSQRILQMPMSLLGTSIAQVYFQKASELRDDRVALKGLTKSISKKLLVIGLLPVAATLALGDHLFAFVFGENWRIAGTFAQYLAVSIYFIFISSPLSHLMVVMDKQQTLLTLNAMLFTARIGWMVVIGLFVGGEELVVAGYAFIGAALRIYFVFYLMGLVGMGAKEVFKLILPYATLAFLSAVIGLLV